jgi:hypothetical protein
VPTDVDLSGRLDAGDIKEARLMSIVNDEPEPMNDLRIEHVVLETRKWLVVETGLRWYMAKAIDNRQLARKHSARTAS